MKAAFRAIQHRFVEAHELAGDAIERLQPGLDSRLLAKTLILRASVAGAEGELEASIGDLTRAMDLVEARAGRLRLSVGHNLATACMDAGRFAEADEMLPLVRDLCSAHGDLLERFQLRWLEAALEVRDLARRLLAEAVARERLTPKILWEVRGVLGDLLRDPSVRLPKKG